jgi:uncharacterized protein (UPF0297 family)
MNPMQQALKALQNHHDWHVTHGASDYVGSWLEEETVKAINSIKSSLSQASIDPNWDEIIDQARTEFRYQRQDKYVRELVAKYHKQHVEGASLWQRLMNKLPIIIWR